MGQYLYNFSNNSLTTCWPTTLGVQLSNIYFKFYLFIEFCIGNSSYNNPLRTPSEAKGISSKLYCKIIKILKNNNIVKYNKFNIYYISTPPSKHVMILPLVIELSLVIIYA